jgi:hypothetical protein
LIPIRLFEQEQHSVLACAHCAGLTAPSIMYSVNPRS